jgi:hypothetical protein
LWYSILLGIKSREGMAETERSDAAGECLRDEDFVSPSCIMLFPSKRRLTRGGVEVKIGCFVFLK